MRLLLKVRPTVRDLLATVQRRDENRIERKHLELLGFLGGSQ